MKEVKIDVVIETANSARSINDLKKSIKELDDAAGDLEIGSEQFEALNKKSKELKDTLGGLGKQSNETGGFLGGLGDKVGGLPGPLGQATSGVAGLGKQFIALLANPIVLVISAIVGAIVLLYKSFTKTEEGGNKVNKVFTVLNGVFSGFLKAIKPIAEFIVDNVVKAFKQLGEILTVVGDGVAKFVGFFSADSEKKLRNFANAIEANVQASLRLAKAEQDLVKANREARKEQLLGQIEAEKLRQQRDDESKSIGERIAANTKLGESLNKQLERELAIAQISLNVAKQRQKVDGDTTQVLDELAEAETNLIDIRERILGQQSEQLANENALRKEAAAAAEEKRKQRKAEADELQKFFEEDLNNKLKQNDIEFQQYVDNLDRKQEFDDAYFLGQIEAADETATKLDAIEDDRIKRRIEAAKLLASTEAEIRNASIDNVADGINLIASLDEENRGLQAAALIGTNAAGIAKTIISTQAANAAATAEGIALAIPSAGASVVAAGGLVAANNISAGISIATSIAATAKGLAGLKASGSAGSKPSLPSGGSAASAAPSLNPQQLFATQNLEGAETEQIGSGGIGQRQQVIKAVVSERDVTAVQNRISNYEQRSEIG